MQTRGKYGLVALVVLIAGSEHALGQDDDPVIARGKKLSTLVEEFKAATTTEDRANLAFLIAGARDKATSAVPTLAGGLADKDRYMRANMARALRTMGPAAKAAAPNLIAALKDRDDAVRAEVMLALGAIGPDAKAAIPLLFAVLKDTAEEAKVRVAAATALGGFKGEAKAAVPLLTDFLKGKDATLRVASARTLFAIDKGNAEVVVPVLREALKDDKDYLTQAAAAEALETLGPDAKNAVPELMALLAKTSAANFPARKALGRIPAAEAALFAALNSPNKVLRNSAGDVLVEYFPEAVKQAAHDKEVKKLEGTWVVTSATQDGKALTDMKGAQLTIAAKEVTIQGKDGLKLSLPFKVDPTKKPSVIDFRLVGGDGWLKLNGTFKGIYELDGDSLRLCIGSDEKRPTKFSDQGAALIVLKRQK